VTILHAGITDVGCARSRNEDNLAVAPDLGLYMVADGMGGHLGGDEASRRACIVVEESVRAQHAVLDGLAPSPSNTRRREVLKMLVGSLRTANERILLEADLHPSLQGMGTTAITAVFGGDRVFIANVGDSRAYLFRDGSATLLTEDHSLFFELVRQGRLSRASASKFPYRNVVTRALGMRGSVQADVFDLEVLPGDRILLCTDGLHGVVEDDDLLRLAGRGPVASCAERLVKAANAAGGPDNITAVLVEVEAIESDPAAVRRRNQAIRTFPVLEGLSTAEWVRLVSYCDTRVYADGSTLFGEGEVGDGLYGVLSGEVEVRRGGKTIQVFGPGTHMGELSLVEETPRLANAVSKGSSEVLFLPRRTFDVLVRQSPQMSAKLLRNLVRALARRLRSTNDELVVLKTYYDAERLEVPAVVPSDVLEEV
jgi:serine/threonine protein phosphatase PrpC/CRP-like cAMP-binding protein